MMPRAELNPQHQKVNTPALPHDIQSRSRLTTPNAAIEAWRKAGTQSEAPAEFVGGEGV